MHDQDYQIIVAGIERDPTPFSEPGESNRNILLVQYIRRLECRNTSLRRSMTAIGKEFADHNLEIHPNAGVQMSKEKAKREEWSTTACQHAPPRKSCGSHIELLSTAEAAEYLGTTSGTLTTWRCTRAVRVPFVKIGRNVRYRLSDLDAFLASQTIDGLEDAS